MGRAEEDAEEAAELVALWRALAPDDRHRVMRLLESLARAERERAAADAHGRPWLEVVDGTGGQR